MPEVTPDASLIIAVSWQALVRAETGDEQTRISNCTVVIVFAAFFIEATINHFIEKARGKEGMSEPPGEHDGLQKKLGWVYNSFLADEPITDTRVLPVKLEEEFPGFEAIRKFRNGVSHGRIDRSATTLENSKQLRTQANAIVERLLRIAKDNDLEIDRAVDYQRAITEP